MMALSAQTLRPNSYPLPHPGTGRLSSRHTPYNLRNPPFTSQLHHHYTPPSYSGLNFQNPPMVSIPGSQAGVIPLSTTSSMQLPGSPESAETGVLSQSTVLRRQSASSHDSPINSPILEDDSGIDQYKPYSYHRTIGSAGMNTTFNSFPTPQNQPTSLPMAGGMGYPNSPSTYHSMYSAHDSMCSNGASALSLPVWNCPPSFSGLNLHGHSIIKPSMDTPRYKLTPERAIPLIKWFEEHKKHPYPTRHEKMLLCQSTQLTYTQVSTWFANARRRIKKANSEEEECKSNHSSSDECGSQNSMDSPLHSS